MARIHDDYDVFGLYGIFLMNNKERKRIMGTIAKRELLLQQSRFPLDPDFARRLAVAGFAPVQPYNCQRTGPLVACWRCQLPITDWDTETDDPIRVHQDFAPNCDYISALVAKEATVRGCNIL